MKISLIIPCFNEEPVIEETYKRIYAVAQKESWDYELVFVNDGSKDKTPEMLDAFAEKDERVVVLHFSRNFGHQPAVSAGIDYCTGDIAVIIDADLQDPPEVIPDMIALHKEKEAEVVYAVRRSRKGENWFKKITAKIFYRFVNFLSNVKLPLDTGDFRLVTRKVMESFKRLPEKNKYIRGLFSWLGYKQEPFAYDRDERFAGETKYPLKKMIKFATTGLLYFSNKPLRLALNLGFLNIFVGIGLAIWILITQFVWPESSVPGWASTMISIIFFGGVQLFTVGIIGEYIGNLFDEVRNRPEYIVSDVRNRERINEAKPQGKL
jgi:glycosyltransferase involved in cell wall biosynthesis